MSHHYAERGGRRTSGSRSKVEQFDFATTFLVVCEGERTEPNYFRAFRVAGDVRTIDIRGEGYNIRNAKLLLSQYQPLNPVKDNPSTKVFELVEALNQSLEKIRRATGAE